MTQQTNYFERLPGMVYAFNTNTTRLINLQKLYLVEIAPMEEGLYLFTILWGTILETIIPWIQP